MKKKKKKKKKGGGNKQLTFFFKTACGFSTKIAVTSFKTDAEVMAHANNTGAGLAAYFFTKDARRAWTVGSALEFGMVCVMVLVDGKFTNRASREKIRDRSASTRQPSAARRSVHQPLGKEKE